MKTYRIRPEYFGTWGEDSPCTIITESDVRYLADEWGKPVEELLAQLDETTAVTIGGVVVSLEAAAELMDDDIREALHAEGVDDPQEFVDRYCKAHLAKFGEAFTV